MNKATILHLGSVETETKGGTGLLQFERINKVPPPGYNCEPAVPADTGEYNPGC